MTRATMSYDLKSDRMLRTLCIGNEKFNDKGITSATERVGPLRLQTQLPRQTMIDAMISEFANSYRVVEGIVSDAKFADADDCTYAIP